MKKLLPYLIILFLVCWHAVTLAQDRFPRPEFESGYVYPVEQFELQRSWVWQYIDVAVLMLALTAATWLALYKRSRSGLLWLSLFSLAYFGFYREGCICAVGSVQNVALALFNPGYTIPATVLLFFIIPLLFALLFGRVFCAGVCPFGAIQELTGFMPVKLPKQVESIMAAVPFIYLASAVLFAATGNQFIICRYDPFVGIFRMNAPYTMVIFGSLLLLAGIFINRPYCRYLCPYGVLLGIFSKFAGKHLTITPAECTDCRLCEESCPYDAILPSVHIKNEEEPSAKRRRFLIYLVLIPFFTASGALILYNLAPSLASINNDVRLAKEIRKEKTTGIQSSTKAVVAFREAGRTEEDLFSGEMKIIERFRKASPWAGAFLGLSLGISLVSLTTFSSRSGYRPDQRKCYSCGRCFSYCPVKSKK
jgi:NosR/NirI family transcriptional regulator, nitrous oxide reductase regulator